MTLFLDASAMLAIIFDEPEAPNLLDAIDEDVARITSGIALWETARALARRSDGPMTAGHREAERFCADFAIAMSLSAGRKPPRPVWRSTGSAKVGIRPN